MDPDKREAHVILVKRWQDSPFAQLFFVLFFFFFGRDLLKSGRAFKWVWPYAQVCKF